MTESNSPIVWFINRWRICTISLIIGIELCVLATLLHASRETIGYVTLALGGGLGLVMLYRTITPVLAANDAGD